MAQGEPAEITCKTHNSAESLQLSPIGSHVPLGVQRLTDASGLDLTLRMICMCSSECLRMLSDNKLAKFTYKKTEAEVEPKKVSH